MKLLSLNSDLGRGSWGKVLAVRWQMGELDRNFITMQTSSGEEENIIGDRCMAELKRMMSEYQDLTVHYGESGRHIFACFPEAF